MLPYRRTLMYRTDKNRVTHYSVNADLLSKSLKRIYYKCEKSNYNNTEITSETTNKNWVGVNKK